MQTIISFSGLCRSGNHAIIYWVIHNLTDSVYFCGSKYDYMYCSTDYKVCFCNNITRAEQFANIDKYQYVIKSYEDTLLDLSDTIYLIRDFLNMICSRYKNWPNSLCPWVRKDGHPYYSDIQTMINAWKIMFHKEKKIIYNDWLLNKSYRDTVSDKLLNIPNIVDNIECIPDIAGGSSFSGTNPVQNKTAYLNRSSQIKLPAYIIDTILQDSELLDLNLQHFNIDIAAKLKEIA